MIKKHKNRRGFTLVELMITAVISVIVILTTTLILFITFRTWRSANREAQFRRDIALSVDYLSKDVRESRASDIATTATTITFSPNDVRPGITYTYTADFNAGTLIRTGDGAAITLISYGLDNPDPDTFADDSSGNGLSLRMVLADDEFNIGVTNETLISVRNSE